ncbi:MAG: hypothetical protein LBF41_03865 [Deltaproteobacteria bacterium]|jgi:hypothetical protein|nr:hypothetical protein [Deltaproteobacteria bacterium]
MMRFGTLIILAMTAALVLPSWGIVARGGVMSCCVDLPGTGAVAAHGAVRAETTSDVVSERAEHSGHSGHAGHSDPAATPNRDAAPPDTRTANHSADDPANSPDGFCGLLFCGQSAAANILAAPGLETAPFAVSTLVETRQIATDPPTASLFRPPRLPS